MAIEYRVTAERKLNGRVQIRETGDRDSLEAQRLRSWIQFYIKSGSQRAEGILFEGRGTEYITTR
ncbi:MAG TPA: hypothetical protein VMC07_01755 [Candidatus Omnitrophota bacterium]|nr:hypothetical protein [Candidatus Omnitrophota bacterium]